MSKLDGILNTLLVTEPETDAGAEVLIDEAKQAIKDLIQKLVDESFDADDKNAMIFWQKVEKL